MPLRCSFVSPTEARWRAISALPSRRLVRSRSTCSAAARFAASRSSIPTLVTQNCELQTSRSAGLGEAQVDLRGGGIAPARGDDLRAGVEVYPLGPVDVPVAEERGLPAAEAVVGDGHRD